MKSVFFGFSQVTKVHKIVALLIGIELQLCSMF